MKDFVFLGKIFRIYEFKNHLGVLEFFQSYFERYFFLNCGNVRKILKLRYKFCNFLKKVLVNLEAIVKIK